mmetsp:Transcript_5499/g.19866  ORF Transcript_5499/g.19866 Transcript_5499/m.19866 type:complete len:320 (+) Transcript_5499:340-1299(+)
MARDELERVVVRAMRCVPIRLRPEARALGDEVRGPSARDGRERRVHRARGRRLRGHRQDRVRASGRARVRRGGGGVEANGNGNENERRRRDPGAIRVAATDARVAAVVRRERRRLPRGVGRRARRGGVDATRAGEDVAGASRVSLLPTRDVDAAVVEPGRGVPGRVHDSSLVSAPRVDRGRARRARDRRRPRRRRRRRVRRRRKIEEEFPKRARETRVPARRDVRVARVPDLARRRDRGVNVRVLHNARNCSVTRADGAHEVRRIHLRRAPERGGGDRSRATRRGRGGRRGRATTVGRAVLRGVVRASDAATRRGDATR